MSRPCRRYRGKLTALVGGSLSEHDAGRVRRHLADCAACGEAFARLEKTRELCRELGAEPAPSLPWRKIETQIQWRLSHAETRGSPRIEPRRPWSWLRPATAFARAVALGALAAVLVIDAVGGERAAAPRGGRFAPSAPPPRTADEGELAGLVTLVQGEVSVVSHGRATPLVPSRPLLQGDRLLTGQGARVALQWATGTGLLLLGESEAELRQLRPSEQEIVLHQGRVAAQVARRQPGQRFSVIASGVRASVKGTQFMVSISGDGVEVEVFEGLVDVEPLDGGWAAVRVPAGLAVRVAGRAPLRPSLAAGARAPAPSLNLQPWPGLLRAMASSGLLAVESVPDGADVSFDTRMVGTTNLTLRGSVGRHLVELWRDGKLLRRQWIEVQLNPGRLALDVRVQPRPQPAARLPESVYGVIRQRAAQIQACYERRLKATPTLEGKLTLRIGIDASGRVASAGLDLDTLPDPRVGQCALAAVRRWEFPAGSAAEVVYPLHLRPR